MPPNSYLTMAEAYWAAAHRLLPDAEGEDTAPFYMVAAHTMELTLKAVLLAQGDGIDTIMMIGHNLDACLRWSVDQGLAKANSPEIAETVRAISMAHHAQAFRYPQHLSWDRPSPGETMTAATRLLKVAREYLSQTEPT